MSKVLFFGLPVHGHTYQALALAKELVERGEEVIYYSTDAFGGDVRSAGAQCRSYQCPFLERLSSTRFTPEWPYLWMKATEDVLAEEQGRVGADRPDYIIYDGLACWGKYLSNLLGVPAVASISTLAFNPQVMELAADSGIGPIEAESSMVRDASIADQFAQLTCLAKAAETRERIVNRYGVSGPGPGFLKLFEVSEKLNIVYTSRLFQPLAETFDGRFQFVGRTIPGYRRQVEFAWDWIVHPTLIYISLGTIFNRDRGFFRMCFDALAEVECQAVVSTGWGLMPEDLGEPPPNVLVRPYVPQNEILKRSAACITNGGLNTVSDSLYHGVPVVAVPSHGEQSLQARRLAELGAGVCLNRKDATSRALREAVERVLGVARERYRQQCDRVGDSFRAGGGVRKAADCVLAFLQGSGAA